MNNDIQTYTATLMITSQVHTGQPSC